MKTSNLYTLLFIGLTVSLFACDDNGICINGEGNIETRTFDLNNFTGVELSESANVTISQGRTQTVTVSAQDNILDRLETNVNGGIWDINLGRGCFNSYDLTVEITIPDLHLVSVSSSGKVTIEDFRNQKDLDLNLSGSGKIRLNEFSGLRNLDARVSGSGKITALKTIEDVENLDLRYSGSGKFDGFDIEVDHCQTDISGSADCFVTVNQSLDVDISGSGNVYYKGNPRITTDISGSGKVINRN